MLNERDKTAAHKYRLLQAQQLIDLCNDLVAAAAGPAASGHGQRPPRRRAGKRGRASAGRHPSTPQGGRTLIEIYPGSGPNGRGDLLR